MKSLDPKVPTQTFAKDKESVRTNEGPLATKVSLLFSVFVGEEEADTPLPPQFFAEGE